MTRNRKLEVIPAIDLLGGQCVRLYQGDFEQVTEYETDPLELAARYENSGARRLHVVDLDGAKTGDPVNLSIIRRLAEFGMKVQAGGGIRDLERLQTLLDAGVEHAVIGSVAVQEPELVADWIGVVGAEHVILAFDIRMNQNREPEVATHGWTRTGQGLLWPLVDRFLEHGAIEFLCTDISKDGTLEGPNIALYRECVRRYPKAEFIASGGVSAAADLYALDEIGVARVVTGKALLDGRLTVEEIRQFSLGE
jgi:phosphoribosylformimino-5-aminoimidazole carboxamide ribotide isomerase